MDGATRIVRRLVPEAELRNPATLYIVYPTPGGWNGMSGPRRTSRNRRRGKGPAAPFHATF